jgi:hypothetical protein
MAENAPPLPTLEEISPEGYEEAPEVDVEPLDAEFMPIGGPDIPPPAEEELPAEAPPVEGPPSEGPPAEAPPVEELPVEAPSAEEILTEAPVEAPVEELPISAPE